MKGVIPDDQGSEWDQVSTGRYGVCAVDMDSKPHCFSLNPKLRGVPDYVEVA